MQLKRAHLVTWLCGAAVAATCGCSGDGGGCAPEEPLCAVASVNVAPAQATIGALGDTVTFTATARDRYGAVVELPPGVAFTWTSSDPFVLKINRVTGLAMAMTNGSVQVTGSSAAADAVGTAAVTVRQVPAMLVMEVQPAASARSGVALAPQPAVRVADALFSTVVGGAVPVTAGLLSAGSATLGGTTTVTSVDGTARFTDLSITGAPAAYALIFTSPGLRAASSSTIGVSPSPPPSRRRRLRA